MLEEQIRRAIDTAYRAEGFSVFLHAQGFIGRGNEAREAIESLLALETTMYPDCVVSARIEVAEALTVLLEAFSYDSGKRRQEEDQGPRPLGPPFMDGDIVICDEARAVRSRIDSVNLGANSAHFHVVKKDGSWDRRYTGWTTGLQGCRVVERAGTAFVS